MKTYVTPPTPTLLQKLQKQLHSHHRHESAQPQFARLTVCGRPRLFDRNAVDCRRAIHHSRGSHKFLRCFEHTSDFSFGAWQLGDRLLCLHRARNGTRHDRSSLDLRWLRRPFPRTRQLHLGYLDRRPPLATRLEMRVAKHHGRPLTAVLHDIEMSHLPCHGDAGYVSTLR